MNGWINIAISVGIAAVALLAMIVYLKSRKKILEQKEQLAEAELALMINQVQPHFLYNVLNSIYYLCGTNPSEAQEAVGEFAEYFRTNLTAITEGKLIPIKQEIENIRIYASLEKIRFEEQLFVEYEIEDVDFMIPPLTVRPLVENAVKHGVNKTDHPLHIRVRVRELEDHYEVEVKDDGPGYKYGVFADKERKHIGIDNVRRRLQLMSDGTLEITGQEGLGTTAVIAIRKE